MSNEKAPHDERHRHAVGVPVERMVRPSAEAHDAAPHDDIGRAALLVMSPEILAELLQLPDGCHIDHATAPHDQPGVLHLRVRGAGWPTKAGWLLPQVRGTVTRHHAEDGSVLRQTIDWGFPKGEGPNVRGNAGPTAPQN